MACTHPIYLKEQDLVVPCGKCFYCRRKYVLQWSLRLTHELISYNNNAVFITLTYNDDNLPSDKSVNVRDVQLFIKRLRKYYPDRKLKYFAVSEYGSSKKTFRPHYHLIVFGLSCDNTKEAVFRMSGIFTKNIWKKGFTTVKPVHENTIQYTVKYILKNTLRDNLKLIKFGYKSNFSLKSKGLGLNYLLENWTKFVYVKHISYKKYLLGVPRFYRDKLIEKGLMLPDYPQSIHKEYLDNLVPEIFNTLRKVRGLSYTNPYQTINSYFTGYERDPDWFKYPDNFDGSNFTLEGNHKEHFFYHYLLYLRDKSHKDEIEFFSTVSVKKKIHNNGVYYGNT